MPRKRVLAEPGERKRGEKPQDAPLARCRCKREASIRERYKAMEERASRSCAPTEPARPVGRAFFPLDEELALLPGTLAPRQQSHLVQLGSWMPFRHASRVLEELLGVSV